MNVDYRRCKKIINNLYNYLTGIINLRNINDKEVSELSKCCVKAGNELNINPSEVDKYLWEVGNTFCNKRNVMIVR